MSSIQKVAKQALITFASRDASVFAANFDTLRSMVGTIVPNDINLDVAPRRTQKNSKLIGAPVSYISICESPYFTLGVFILKSNVPIPLHDHPGMHGICKVLYGSVKVKSYDSLASNGHMQDSMTSPGKILQCKFNGLKEYFPSSDPCTLSPTSGNFHSIQAHNGQAAFLDILAPPYVTGERDCTYYRECTRSEVNQLSPEDSESIEWLVEIPQPSNFYCDSLPYKGPPIDLEV